MLYFFTNTFMTNFEQEFTAKAEYLALFVNIVIGIFCTRIQALALKKNYLCYCVVDKSWPVRDNLKLKSLSCD